MPDVHLNRRVIFARDQAVRPRALSRDVQIDVISVGVDHCFGGCFVATFAFVTRFAKKKCAFFQEGKEKRASKCTTRSRRFFRSEKKERPRPLLLNHSTPDEKKKGQIWASKTSL
tara:strand:+ start:257 stop:601 length:345 start_codon:yes stop_codon:yes gene_type:complete